MLHMNNHCKMKIFFGWAGIIIHVSGTLEIVMLHGDVECSQQISSYCCAEMAWPTESQIDGFLMKVTPQPCHQPGCCELKRIKIPRNQFRAGVRGGVRCGMIDFDGSHHRRTLLNMFLDKMIGKNISVSWVLSVITTLFFWSYAAKFWGFIWLKFSLFHRFICDWNKIVKLSPLLFANFDQVFIN